jgi:hypothetical protein
VPAVEIAVLVTGWSSENENVWRFTARRDTPLRTIKSPKVPQMLSDYARSLIEGQEQPVLLRPWPPSTLPGALQRACRVRNPSVAKPQTAAEDLLEIIMRRYERASTLLTSNRSVEDWGKLLGDTAAVAAFLDRLLHHAHVLTCGPRSWRTRLQGERSEA